MDKRIGYSNPFNNDRYLVEDYQIEGLTVSITHLHTDQETRGHSHPHRETYIFVTDALMRLGTDNEWFPVKATEHVQVRPGVFHQVRTLPGKEASFYAIWEGVRE